LTSLEKLWQKGYFQSSQSYRLAFREFGTTLGVQCHNLANARWSDRVVKIHEFWENKLYSRDHDITPIMFCTSLIPGSMFRDYIK